MGHVMRVRGGKPMADNDSDGDLESGAFDVDGDGAKESIRRAHRSDGNRGGLRELHAHGKPVKAHVRPVIRQPDPRKGGHRTSAAGKAC